MVPASVKLSTCSRPPHSVRTWATVEVQSHYGLKIFRLVLICFRVVVVFCSFILFTGYMLSGMILAGRAWGWALHIRDPVQDCASGQLAPHCFVRWWLWSVGTKGTCRRSGSFSPNPL